jgi:hypothetical protein
VPNLLEGTEYDLTQTNRQLPGSPFGDPARYDASPETEVNGNGLTQAVIDEGGFERAISMFRTSYSVVSQTRPNAASSLAKSVVFVSQYAPHAGVYTPIYISSGVGERAMPECFSKGSLYKFDHYSSYWRFASVGNWLARWFKYAILDVRAVQVALEDQLFAEMAGAEAAVAAAEEGGLSAAEAAEALTAVSHDHAARFMERYSKLFEELIARYHDGYRLENPEATVIKMDKLFYPKWWLEVAGFFRYREAPAVPGADDDPVRVAQHADGSLVTDDGRFDDGSRIDDTTEATLSSPEPRAPGWSSAFLIASNLIVATVAAATSAWLLGRKKGVWRSDYAKITEEALAPRLVVQMAERGDAARQPHYHYYQQCHHVQRVEI